MPTGAAQITESECSPESDALPSREAKAIRRLAPDGMGPSVVGRVIDDGRRHGVDNGELGDRRRMVERHATGHACAAIVGSDGEPGRSRGRA